MIIDFLHKFTIEKYIFPKYHDNKGAACLKGYWYFDFKKGLLMYNWDNGNIPVPKGPYINKIGEKKDWSNKDREMYDKFYKDWLTNAHKPSL